MDKIWTNPAIGLHFFLITFGFVHMLPEVGLKQPNRNKKSG